MQFKKLVLVLAQLGLVSAIGVAVAKQSDQPLKQDDQPNNISEVECKQETFWANWFGNTNKFKDFGVSHSEKEMSKARYEFAENYNTEKVNTKDRQSCLLYT